MMPTDRRDGTCISMHTLDTTWIYRDRQSQRQRQSQRKRETDKDRDLDEDRERENLLPSSLAPTLSNTPKRTTMEISTWASLCLIESQ